MPSKRRKRIESTAKPLGTSLLKPLSRPLAPTRLPGALSADAIENRTGELSADAKLAEIRGAFEAAEEPAAELLKALERHRAALFVLKPQLAHACELVRGPLAAARADDHVRMTCIGVAFACATASASSWFAPPPGAGPPRRGGRCVWRRRGARRRRRRCRRPSGAPFLISVARNSSACRASAAASAGPTSQAPATS